MTKRYCPYNDPDCTGTHDASLPKAEMCPSAYARELIEAEIAKCDVRCANCHRVVTAERRDAAVIGA